MEAGGEITVDNWNCSEDLDVATLLEGDSDS